MTTDESLASLVKESLPLIAEGHRDTFLQHVTRLDEVVQNVDRTKAEVWSDRREDAQQACMLFVAREITRGQCDGKQSHLGLPVNKLAAVARTNLFDFFRELPATLSQIQPFLDSCGVSSAELVSRANVSHWQKALVSITLLWNKYKDKFSQYMLHLTSHKVSVSQLGWLIFLVAKAKLLPPFPDLESCVDLLACVLHILAANAPQPPLHQSGPDSHLLKVCEALRSDPERVKLRMVQVAKLLDSVVSSVGNAPQQQEGSEMCDDQCNARKFIALVCDPDMVNKCLRHLEHQYEDMYRGEMEIDEREFLHKDIAAYASPMFSPTAGNQAAKLGFRRPLMGSPLSSNCLPSYLRSPTSSDQSQPTLLYGALQSPVPTTRLYSKEPQASPISRALHSIQWLRSLVGQAAESGESGEMPKHLSNQLVGVDPALLESLPRMVNDLTMAAFPDTPSSVGQPGLKSQVYVWRVQTLKLYYHTLKLVLGVDSGSMPGSSQAKLLRSSSFNKGMLVCCAEVVIAANSIPSDTFPDVLTCFNLNAFELLKIVHPFVYALPAMPEDLRLHLSKIEEKVLGSLSWEMGSSLYPLLNSVVNPPPPHAPSASVPQAEASHPAKANSATASASASPLPPTPAESNATPSTSTPASLSQSHSAPLASSSTPSEDVSNTAFKSSQELPTCASVGEKRDVASASHPSPAKRLCPSPAKDMFGFSAGRGTGPSGHVSGRAPTVSIPMAIGRLSLSDQTGSAKSNCAVLMDFMRKVLKLCAFRLSLLLFGKDALDVAPFDAREVYGQVLLTCEEVLCNHTHLLYNGHIDAVLVSALFAFCKANKLSQKVTFRSIIAIFRLKPKLNGPAHLVKQSSLVVKQSLPDLEGGGWKVEAKGDIIAFYTHTYLPIMQKWHKGRGSVAAAKCPLPLPRSMHASPSVSGTTTSTGKYPNTPSAQGGTTSATTHSDTTSSGQAVDAPGGREGSSEEGGEAPLRGPWPPARPLASSLPPSMKQFYPSLRSIPAATSTPDGLLGPSYKTMPSHSSSPTSSIDPKRLMPPPPPQPPRLGPSNSPLVGDVGGGDRHIPNGLAALLRQSNPCSDGVVCPWSCRARLLCATQAASCRPGISINGSQAFSLGRVVIVPKAKSPEVLNNPLGPRQQLSFEIER
eukprot:gene27337-4636_t